MNDISIALSSVRRKYKEKVIYSAEDRTLHLQDRTGNITQLKREHVEYWSRRVAITLFGEQPTNVETQR
jgi:hypothetical protein